MKKPLLAILLLVATPVVAHGDAIMVTQAMSATTIVEIFVGSDSIVVDVEIGVEDIDAFRNIMPDPIYERLGHEPIPLAERVALFFEKDWLVLADGAPLEGRITDMTARPRILRDAITGEPLPAGDQDAELVVFARIAYPLASRPRLLTILPPSSDGGVRANIGFVTYHKGLPVIDFRYLAAEETLELDWDDPWYSRFRNRNLRRQFDAPLSVFLYVEHFEVRKEVVVRPKDLQQWVDLGLEGKETIAVEDQEELKRRVADFLLPRGRVTIDGVEHEPTLDRVHFVRRTLRRTGVIDPPEDIATVSATLGVIFVYPVDSIPDEVNLQWDLFGGRIERIPAVATDEAGGLPSFLLPEDSVLTWRNFLTNPKVPAVVELAAAPAFGRVPVPVISVACLLVGAVAVWSGARRRAMLFAAVAFVMIGVVMWPHARVTLPVPFVKSVNVSAEEADTIVSGLLTNVYRAFDYRDESDIYDALSRSASGDLLTAIYLETRKALELQNQGGARVKVDEVTMESIDPAPLRDDTGFAARCVWNVTGSVGHWGHIHRRTNQYEAQLTIVATDGVWKITSLELLQEQRITIRNPEKSGMQSRG